MIRKHFHKLKKLHKDKITWRSHEVTRIEAFSDAVFGFSVSLMVISLEVPKNSQQLLRSLTGMFPFALCFLILFWIWRGQYKFFRRYGLHDPTTFWLNGILLFIVLGYVYPLKFIFSSAFLPGSFVLADEDRAALIMLYSGGHSILAFLFSLMYYNAYLKKEAIKLTPVEIFETVNGIWSYAIPSCVSLIVVVTAYLMRYSGNKISYVFLAYALIGIFMRLFNSIRNKQFIKRFGDIPAIEPNHNPEG